MGYFSKKEIVQIDDPKRMTLTNNPNFLTFLNVRKEQKTQPSKIVILMISNDEPIKSTNITEFRITQIQTQKKHSFFGVYDEKDITDKSFIIDKSKGGEISTIYNLQECLLRDSFIRNNFDVIVQLNKTDNDVFTVGNTLELISKGYGAQYDCAIDILDDGVSIGTVAIEDIALKLNLNYANIMEGDDNELCIHYSPESMRSYIVSSFTGKLSEDQVNFYGDFLIVKPETNKYTEEEARIATLQNLKIALLNDIRIKDMFDVELDGSISLLLTYKLSSKYVLLDIDNPELLFDSVELCNMDYYPHYDYYKRYVFKNSYQKSIGTDSIDDGLGNYKIELDVYTDTGVEWGKEVNDLYLKGTYLTTLSKSYFGKPLWFELNTLMSKKSSYSPLFLTAFDTPNTAWIDTGTMNNYRFVARRTGQNNTEPIYMSDVLYTINGYDYTLNDSHLGYGDTEVDNYTLNLSQDFASKDFRKVKPLTTNLKRTHLKGQKQYLNCIVKKRAEAVGKSLEISVLYKVYTQSGKLINELIDLQINADAMHVMNVTQLNLDQFLPVYDDKKVGQIDVCLITPITNNPTKKYIEVSETMTYRILPSGLHTVKDFAFLNRLGGWDSMNFGGSVSNEFKVTSSTIFKTLQPDFKSYTEIESLSYKSVEEKLTVQSSPISRRVVEWLREMAASPAVYELSTRRYVLIDDMTLKYNSKDDLFQIDLKYHYSDVFNGRMK